MCARAIATKKERQPIGENAMSQPPVENASRAATERDTGPAQELKTRLRGALKDLRFGQIIISVQDGHITRIEMNEKVRLYCAH